MGATFKIDDGDFTRCISNGWLTREGGLTHAGQRLSSRRLRAASDPSPYSQGT